MIAKKISFLASPALGIAAALAAMAFPAKADGLQPGYWKITSTPEVNGAPAAPQEKLRCMSPAETSDLGKTFSPEANTVNATCERVEHELTPTALKWRGRLPPPPARGGGRGAP